MQGKVVSWTLQKYYGFIEIKDSNKHVFFPGKSVLLPPGETVAIGDLVEFDLVPDRRHPNKPELAANVKILKRAMDGVRGEREGRPRYFRADMTAMAGRRQAAEELLGPVRQVEVFRGN